MNFEQVVARAESERSHLRDEDSVRVLVSALADLPAAAETVAVLRNGIERSGARARVVATGSLGYYDLEPIVIIERAGRPTVLYHNVIPEKASELGKCCVTGAASPDLAFCTIGSDEIIGIPRSDSLPLFCLQKRIVLHNCGFLDPESISDYIAAGHGYAGFARALGMDRAGVVGEIEESRLRGRGGAGFLTADKWKAVRDGQTEEKYLICNAVDGDPKARTARLLLEGDPHSVLEGVLIAAYAIGASRCVICPSSGPGAAVKRLEKALEQAREYGLVGANILDSAFDCEIEIREVAPSLVAGEETALLRALQGRQAMPYVRPPFPAIEGIDHKPTLINNVETLCNVPAILLNGPGWFSSLGTERSKGTKVVTLAGSAVHQYTVEVPFGTTVGTILHGLGGGTPEGKPVKTVQFGGPTGTYLSPDAFDTRVDYESIEVADSIMGSGTIETIDGDACAVEMTAASMSLIQGESCGKCVFCREGTSQMADLLNDIVRGEGNPQDLDLLTELGEEMRIGSICALGQTAYNPVRTSLKLFRHEYDMHIKEKKCPAEAPRKE